MYEINALTKYQHFRIQEGWDMTRMLAFYIARCHGSKINKLQDVVKFPWDSDFKKNSNGNKLESEEDIKQFDEERKRLREKAQRYLNNVYSN